VLNLHRLNAGLQVIKGGGDHGEKEVYFGAALHPAILRAKEEVIGILTLSLPSLSHSSAAGSGAHV
jgi:hypothetical protein